MIKKTQEPTFNEKFTLTLGPHMAQFKLIFNVRDWDAMTQDDNLGWAQVTISQLLGKLTSGGHMHQLELRDQNFMKSKKFQGVIEFHYRFYKTFDLRTLEKSSRLLGIED